MPKIMCRKIPILEMDSILGTRVLVLEVVVFDRMLMLHSSVVVVEADRIVPKRKM